MILLSSKNICDHPKIFLVKVRVVTLTYILAKLTYLNCPNKNIDYLNLKIIRISIQ